MKILGNFPLLLIGAMALNACGGVTENCLYTDNAQEGDDCFAALAQNTKALIVDEGGRCIDRAPAPKRLTTLRRTTDSISITVDFPAGTWRGDTEHSINASNYGYEAKTIFYDDNISRIEFTFLRLKKDTSYRIGLTGFYPSEEALSKWAYIHVRTAKEEAPTPTTRRFDFTYALRRQSVYSGWVPYVGTLGPIKNGRIVDMLVPGFGYTDWALFLVRPGYSTRDCGNPEATIRVVEGERIDSETRRQLWGSSEPRRVVNAIACLATSDGRAPASVPLKVTWEVTE